MGAHWPASGSTETDPVAEADLAAHVAAGDPHTQYQKESEKAQPSGYASLDGSGQVPADQLGNAPDPDLSAYATDADLATEASARAAADTAEATARSAALAAHEADTTNIHGIADTSALATSADVATEATARAAADTAETSARAAALAAHEADTTNIHGIADTSALALTTDSRFTNARTPTAHAASHASGGSDPVTLAESQVTNLVTDLAAKAPLASPALTGAPTAPTAAQGTNTTQIASTAYVQTEAGLLIPKSLIDAKGDLLVGSADNVVIRKAVGTDGQVLTADSAQTGGVKWADAAGGGAPSGAAGGDLTGTYPNPTVKALSGDTNLRTSLAAGAMLDWAVDAPGGVSDTFGADTSANFLFANRGQASDTNTPSVSAGLLNMAVVNNSGIGGQPVGIYDTRTSIVGDAAVRMQLGNVAGAFQTSTGQLVGLLLGYQTGDSQALYARFLSPGGGTIGIFAINGSFGGIATIAASGAVGFPNPGDWLEFVRTGNTLTVNRYSSDGVTLLTTFGGTIAAGQQARFGAGTQGYAGIVGGTSGSTGGTNNVSIDNFVASAPGGVRSNIKRFSSNLIGSEADWRARDLIAGRYLKPPTYTVATLPSASAMPGALVYVSDAAAGTTRLQYSDGTSWTASAPVASPALTGTPTAPTQAAADSSTKLATTAYADRLAQQVYATNTQTGTAYTTVLADAGKVIESNNAAAMTLTIPPNSSVAYPIGTRLRGTRLGAGALTIVQGAGVVLRNRIQPAGTTNRTVTAQYGMWDAYKRGTDEWVLTGDIA